MTPLVRRSIAALASTAFMTFALAGALPLNAAQDAGTTKTKTQTTKKKSASKAKGSKKKAEADPEPRTTSPKPSRRPRAAGRRLPTPNTASPPTSARST